MRKILPARRAARRFALIAVAVTLSAVTLSVPQPHRAHAYVGQTCVPGDNAEPRSSGVGTAVGFVDGGVAQITMKPTYGFCAGDQSNSFGAFAFVGFGARSGPNPAGGPWAQIGPVEYPNGTICVRASSYAYPGAPRVGTDNCAYHPPTDGTAWTYGVTYAASCHCEQMWVKPAGGIVEQVLVNTSWDVLNGQYQNTSTWYYDEADDVNTGLLGEQNNSVIFSNLQRQSWVTNTRDPVNTTTTWSVDNQHPGGKLNDAIGPWNLFTVEQYNPFYTWP